ncbi:MULTISPECIES: phosphotransferase [unclassified Rhodococcus (in: high G+C Gram-positive bacteria)]|uniref:phosphotransferase n=1 Tax=unclassified Rhodococcus (in: high G+C Gram-positive bacteria) TaxID=192944 RepID=UPI00163A77F1|nr:MULTISPECIES: phosphotransferase [unclassified Rhodococcus (in: high G+C Gram-positive bacteria)]MBC2640263.1 phosphotransferase [Rhodococcus sp. 3A]MBC2894991.1 phosphotransferase [Rhodococcus sp. 4CII]
MAVLGDVAFVERWFRERLGHIDPHATDVRIAAAERLSRGVSRETWSVTATVQVHGTWSPQQFVVRRDHASGSIIPTSLQTEYDVYRLLRDSAIPTSKALWFEADADWCPDSRPAYVRTHVAGDWKLPFISSTDEAHDEMRIAASKEHLDKLALVHTADWKGLGFADIFAVPDSPADCAANLIRANVAQLERFQFEPSPILREGVSRLLQSAPRDCPQITLCKGTNGHGEEVWSGGRIVAMSDWELAALGDPAYDFAQIQEMIPEIERGGRRLWGLPEALSYYYDHTGIEVTVERIDYYRALYGLLQFLYTHHAAAQVRHQDHPSLRFVWNAAEIGFHSEVRLAGLFGAAPGEVRSSQ